MHDFAKTQKRKPGFLASPFTVYKRQQQQKVFLTVVRKLGIAMGLILLSFIFSSLLVALFLLKSSTWKRDRTVGISVLTSSPNQILKDTTVVWIDPQSRQTQVLSYPGSLSVHTKKSGTYTLTALYGLYALDGEKPESFLASLVRNVRIDIPFLVVWEGVPAPSATSLRQFALSLLFNVKGVYAISLPDRFAVFWYLFFTNQKTVSTALPVAVTSSEQGLDDIAYDKFVQKEYVNTAVKKEALSLSVVNASAQGKLASTVGRVFTTLGLNVLSVSDTPNVVDDGSIVVSDGKLMHSKTVALLGRYVQVKVRVDPQLTSEYRADVVLFLGKREAKEFAQ